MTPFRVTFEVAPELQPHLDVVPKHGLIQGQSSFAAQLKFLPGRSITESRDCLEYFDEARGAFTMPVKVLVADQASYRSAYKYLMTES